MRSLQDGVNHQQEISEGHDEAPYPQLLATLESLNAEIAAARVLEVASATRDTLQTMSDLGISLQRLTDCRRGRLPARANETRYRNPQTGAMWNGRGKPPEWLRGKIGSRFKVEPPVDMSAELTHETES